MGQTWNEKYINPTRVFFETLYQEWTEIKKKSENEEVFI